MPFVAFPLRPRTHLFRDKPPGSGEIVGDRRIRRKLHVLHDARMKDIDFAPAFNGKIAGLSSTVLLPRRNDLFAVAGKDCRRMRCG